MKAPLVIIAGPTACGKTDIAIDLALKINGEVISADSMQVYKYMDIGTAKISKSDMKGVPHHLIDILYPDEDFSVAVFKDMAKACINDIHSRGKVPILVGGTGFYINAVMYDTNFTSIEENEKDTAYRENLYAEDKALLYNMLKEVDPEAASYIHENNIKKVVRALEYYKKTGQKISEHNKEEQQRTEAYKTHFFILNRDRQLLYRNIEKRVDYMLQEGLVDEVKSILQLGYKKDLVSMNGIGYKEIVCYLKDEISLCESVELLKRNTRRFAKRQITWFKNKSNGIWIDVDKDKAVDRIIEMINIGEF